MKSYCALAACLLIATPQDVAAFGSFTGTKVNGVQNSATVTMEYIPSGMSKAQWEKIKAQEKSKNKGKNLGKVGITTFQSQSFAEWQKKGAKNLFPVDPKKAKSAADIPYMQRPGGKPDNSDLKKGGFGGFNFFGKKKEETEEPPEEPKTNWWTLN